MIRKQRKLQEIPGGMGESCVRNVHSNKHISVDGWRHCTVESPLVCFSVGTTAKFSSCGFNMSSEGVNSRSGTGGLASLTDAVCVELQEALDSWWLVACWLWKNLWGCIWGSCSPRRNYIRTESNNSGSGQLLVSFGDDYAPAAPAKWCVRCR